MQSSQLNRSDAIRDPAGSVGSSRPLHLEGGAITLILVLLATLFGCGRKADPLPPLSLVPAPARDVSLHQQGDLLILDMGYPQTTTSGQVLPGLGAVEVWWLRLPEGALSLEVPPRTYEASAQRLLEITGPELASSVLGNRIEARFPMPAGLEDGTRVVFSTRSVSRSGESSPFSNKAGLVVKTPPAPPSELRLVATASGILVEWQPSPGSIATNIYRRLATERRFGPPVEKTPAAESSLVDRGVSFAERYLYSVRAVAGTDPLVESEASSEIEIEYLDTFAPAPPASVLALGEPTGVRLVLEASPSADTIGYIVYRQDPEADFRRVTADPITSLEFLDSGLTSGFTYRYYATAVDAAGNEGEPSSAVAVTLP